MVAPAVIGGGIGSRRAWAVVKRRSLVKQRPGPLVNPLGLARVERALVKQALVKRTLVKWALTKPDLLARVRLRLGVVRWGFASGRWKTNEQRRKRPDRWRMGSQEISGRLRLELENSLPPWRCRNWQEGRRRGLYWKSKWEARRLDCLRRAERRKSRFGPADSYHAGREGTERPPCWKTGARRARRSGPELPPAEGWTATEARSRWPGSQ